MDGLRFGSHPPSSPTDSCVSIGAMRPSLVWLFNHIRQDDREYITKSDLSALVGGAQVDSGQLDEAFENLDLDKDGEVSLDDFVTGFAKFWREAPHTPGVEGGVEGVVEGIPNFTFPSGQEHYESDVTDHSPSKQLKESLVVLSSHNRQSIESLWQSLSESNPELLCDFEDFVMEVAGEVQVAQRALVNQRRAIKKEACELDEEIESRLSAAQTTLHMQTTLVKEQVRAKLAQRLTDKESELMVVRGQLEELEEEALDAQKLHTDLQEQYHTLQKEKIELHEKLQESEKKLKDKQLTTGSKALVELEQQQSRLYRHEEELLKQKREYEEAIAKLKNQLDHYSRIQRLPSESSDDLDTHEATPDLLATSRPRAPSRGSLRDEIVQKEGVASHLLRGELQLESNPFRERSRSFRGKRKETKKPAALVGNSLAVQSGLTMSLPNLADIDEMGNIATSKQTVYIPVFVTSRQSPNLPVVEQMVNNVTNTISSGGGRMDAVGHHIEKPIIAAADQVPTNGIHETDHVTVNADQVTTGYELGRSNDVDGDDSSLPSGPEHPLQSLQDPEYQRHCKPMEFLDSLRTKPDYVFKILVVGNSFVGKSSYLFRMCNNAFSQRYSSTIGVDFYSKSLRTEDKKIVSLQLWDTAGQERFQSVTKAYYRGAQGVVLMYDISSEESFLAVKTWINSIHNNTDTPPAAMVLVGNKVDLEESREREVSTDTGDTFAKIYGADFIETSAKTGYNVANSLLMLVRAVKEYYDKPSNKESKIRPDRRDSVQVTHPIKEGETKCWCSR